MPTKRRSEQATPLNAATHGRHDGGVGPEEAGESRPARHALLDLQSPGTRGHRAGLLGLEKHESHRQGAQGPRPHSHLAPRPEVQG